MSENNENTNPMMNPEQVKKLCEEVRRKDLILKDMDVRISWYKDAIEEQKRINAENENRRKKIELENRDLHRDLELIQYIERSTKTWSEQQDESLEAFDTLKVFAEKEIKSTQLDALKKKEQLDKAYMEAEKRMTENPLYKELEKAKAEALIKDIEARQLQLAIRTRKGIFATRKDIDKKQFQNFCIRLAQYCLIQKNQEFFERLKAEEKEKIQKFFMLQKEERMERVKKINTSVLEFGSQSSQVGQVANTSGVSETVLPQKRKMYHCDASKLHDLFYEDFPKRFHNLQARPQVSAENVHIINQKIIFPASASSPKPEFCSPEKRKFREIDSDKTNAVPMEWSPQSSYNFQKPPTHETEANDACIEKFQESSQSSYRSLEDSFMKHNTPQNFSMFKKPLPKQYQANLGETVDTDGLQMMTGPSLLSPQHSFGSQPASTPGSQMIPQSILSTPKDPNARHETFGEQPKSVRFNLENPPSPLNKSLEKPKSMGHNYPKPAHPRNRFAEGNEATFNFFLPGTTSTPMNFDFNDTEEPSSANSSIDHSLLENEDNGGMEFNNSEKENNSTDYTYENVPDAPRTGSATGFFSFGSSAMFPFK